MDGKRKRRMQSWIDRNTTFAGILLYACNPDACTIAANTVVVHAMDDIYPERLLETRLSIYVPEHGYLLDALRE